MGGDAVKLWLIWQTVNNNWDTYDSAVVCAETEDEAKHIHPNGYKNIDWALESNNRYSTWCGINHVKCNLIGEALKGTKAGLVLASFNAG